MNKLLLLGCLLCFQISLAQSKIYKSNEVDTYPIISNDICKNLETESCFTLQLMSHVSTNLKYPEEALEKGTTGKAYVQFIVDSLGTVSDIKARSLEQSFIEEAIRVVNTLPKMVPAQKDGRAVSVSHSFPMVFTIDIETAPTEEREPLIACEKAPFPAIFLKCKRAKDQKRCLEDKLFEIITKSKRLHLGDGEKFSGRVRVYFEISTDGSISNAVAVTTFPEAKTAVEKYLMENEVVLEPAKNENNEPIPSHFKAELSVLAVGRVRN
ncbi:energy transducer TonB [uncultured Allomuricauda sp.]|uniref:energy transducer TonB n=1 Tax=Flagellimonas sp. W118 TaxID=3410791 RepID=UPI00261363C4|nr:energy transducer TonB [uncultured Allomuricauda sp.]